MKIEIDNRSNVKISDLENDQVLDVKKVTYPMAKYGNYYYDGVIFEAGRKKVRVSSYGGGYGWARRGSMYESWSDENVHYITIEEYRNILAKLKEIINNESDVDKEAELVEYVNTLFEQHL
jgi:hypothetical protein